MYLSIYTQTTCEHTLRDFSEVKYREIKFIIFWEPIQYLGKKFQCLKVLDIR